MVDQIEMKQFFTSTSALEKQRFEIGAVFDNGRISAFSEAAIRAFYRFTLNPGDAAIDGGAAFGQHTIGMAVVLGDQGRIYAFEPAAESYRMDYEAALAQHLSGQGLDKIIDRRPIALAALIGEADFTLVHQRPGFSGLNIGASAADLPRETIKVRVSTIDDEVTVEDRKRIRFIKLDLEGGEYNALLGATRVIAAGRPMIAFEFGRERTAERYSFTRDDFFGFFASQSYDLFTAFGAPFTPTDWGKPVREVGHDFFAVPQETQAVLPSCGAMLAELAKTI